MTRFMALKMMFLGFIIAVATVACGSVKPNGSASPPDAQTPADAVTVHTDRPAPTPDVVMTSDTPSPPPTDVQMPVDNGMPVVDVTMSTDAGTPVDSTDATMVAEATVVDSGSVAFDSMCAIFNGVQIRVRGSTVPAERVVCTMQPDGTANIRMSTGMSGAMHCGYTRGQCMDSTCIFTEPGETDWCRWQALSTEMMYFNTINNNGETSVVDLLR